MPLIAALSDSVPPEVKVISEARAPSACATSARACSSARLADSPTSWWLDGLPKSGPK